MIQDLMLCCIHLAIEIDFNPILTSSSVTFMCMCVWYKKIAGNVGFWWIANCRHTTQGFASVSWMIHYTVTDWPVLSTSFVSMLLQVQPCYFNLNSFFDLLLWNSSKPGKHSEYFPPCHDLQQSIKLQESTDSTVLTLSRWAKVVAVKNSN